VKTEGRFSRAAFGFLFTRRKPTAIHRGRGKRARPVGRFGSVRFGVADFSVGLEFSARKSEENEG
jgi:hypothetical protein